MEKIRYKQSNTEISPYLRRPLRSLADAMADREAADAFASLCQRRNDVAKPPSSTDENRTPLSGA